LTAERVPPNVKVPELVIGPPVNVNPVVPPDAATEVTVPVLEIVVHAGAAPAPPEVRTCPAVPALPSREILDEAPKDRVLVRVRLAAVVAPVNVGLADKTTDPVPVDVVVPVPPYATARVQQDNVSLHDTE